MDIPPKSVGCCRETSLIVRVFDAFHACSTLHASAAVNCDTRRIKGAMAKTQ